MPGAIVGEWFGAERGLGPLLVSSMQNYRIDIMWSAALLGELGSALAYGQLALLQRYVAAEFRDRARARAPPPRQFLSW